MSETKVAESAPEKQPSSEQEEEQKEKVLLTQAELQKKLVDAVNAAKGEEGRKSKLALQKAQQQAEESLNKLQQQNEELIADIEELGKDDEDKSRLAELLRKNKKLSDQLEGTIKAYEPKIIKAEDYELTQTCSEIAKDYENADPARLKRIAARAKLSGEDMADQIRELADDIWNKKTVTPPVEEKRPVDSQRNTGIIKRTYTNEEIVDYDFYILHKADIELAQIEGRIK